MVVWDFTTFLPCTALEMRSRDALRLKEMKMLKLYASRSLLLGLCIPRQFFMKHYAMQVVQDPENEGDVSSAAEDRKQTVFDTEPQEKSSSGPISELIVPVSSACTCLTPTVLHSLCRLGHGRVHQVILGLVDSNGVVTRCCLYDYIQAPLGGTGTAQLRPSAS